MLIPHQRWLAALLLALSGAACGGSSDGAADGTASAGADAAPPAAAIDADCRPLETRAPNVPDQHPAFAGQTLAS